MLILKCGNISKDDVMLHAIAFSDFSQKFQFDYGYNWIKNYWSGYNEDFTVETNNDHFLNGVRCAILDGLINLENVDILFYHDLENHKNHCTRIMINTKGRLDSWPTGFFDQSDIALNRLLDWGE